MRRIVVCFFVLSILAGGAFTVVPVTAYGAESFLTEEDKARLQDEYNKIQAEIAEWQKVLDETRTKKNTLQGDVTQLNALIKKAEAEIKKRNVSITRLSDEITQKSELISSFEAQLKRGRASLANMIRLQNEADHRSLAEIVLSNEDFDDLYGSLEAIAVVRRSLQELFDEVRNVKESTEVEKEQLAKKRNQELDAKYDVELTKKQIAVNEAEKKKLLSITKDQEKTYSTVLAERQRRAEQIRNALFPLRDAEGISFGTALDAANRAAQVTGVRAALILAILSQESDLGKNVGSCFVTDLESGDGVGKNTGTAFQKVMKAPRDTSPFERITNQLGLTWAVTPVSCPLGRVYTSSRGYGGAMGPSQFIPSTWQLYESKLSTALNVSLPNPWDAHHAIMATALYLKDLGAAGGTYTAERNAACRYYSGRSCDNRTPVNTPYGESVIKKAETFQDNIDFLKGV
jgi:peptidoglycan hydrolase CwlO-like protein